MERLIAMITALILVFCSLSACSKRTYEDGYADGYNDGYRAAIEASEDTYISFEEWSNAKHAAEETEPTLSSLPEPDNGYIFEDFTLGILEKVAPLTIEAGGTGGYYIVVDPVHFTFSGAVDSFSRTRYEMGAKYSYLKFYVDANSAVDVLVPLGEYEIYYATGENWYGEDSLFGSDTRYYKCDSTFLFSIEDNQYTGWTVELKPVINGNLDTDVIDAEDFPK